MLLCVTFKCPLGINEVIELNYLGPDVESVGMFRIRLLLVHTCHCSALIGEYQVSVRCVQVWSELKEI